MKTREILGMAVVCVAALLFMSPVEVRAGSFFTDDFGDNNLRDGSPAKWGAGAYGSMKAVDGDLILTPTPGSTYAGSFVVGSYTDASVRTRFRMEDTSIHRAGVYAGMAGEVAYFAAIQPTGHLELYRRIDYVDELVAEADVSGIDAITNDVHMQLDLFGSLVTVAAWAEGSPKPDQPQLSLEDTMVASGKLGVWMRSSGGSTAYRLFAAIPEPSTAALLASVAPCLAALLRRRKIVHSRQD